MFFLVMTVITRFIVPALPTPILSGNGIWVSRQSPQWLPDPPAQDGEERPGRAQLDSSRTRPRRRVWCWLRPDQDWRKASDLM